MPRRARPGRQLDGCLPCQAAIAVGVRVVPCAAGSGSQACPLVMTACSYRRIAAAMTVCTWVGVSLFCSRPVRYW
jgi:hypothetical protein